MPACLADFMPDPYPEYGHHTHCVAMPTLDPDLLYQQNHCGLYRMRRAEERWVRIGDSMPRQIGGSEVNKKTCFVVMGFGKKTDFETGRTLHAEAYAIAAEKWMEGSTRDQRAKLEPLLAASPLSKIVNA